jgi:hypothetical protein
MRLNLLAVSTLALIAGCGIVSNASAVVRVEATVRTPNVRVRVSNKPAHYPIRVRKPLPMRGYGHHRMLAQDRMIARRLARYTGVPARELIHMKRLGYNWFEIGRWLYLPRPVVRAAMHERSWRRFLRMERRLAFSGTRTYAWRHVTYLDDDGSSDED